MLAKELAAILLENPDRLVIIAKDQEGNGFSEFSDYSLGNNYSDGEIGLSALTPELEDEGYSEEDLFDGIPAIVLWP